MIQRERSKRKGKKEIKRDDREGGKEGERQRKGIIENK